MPLSDRIRKIPQHLLRRQRPRVCTVRNGTARYIHQWPSGTDPLPHPFFSSLISARRAREMRRVLCARVRVHTLARMHGKTSVCRFRVHQREPISAFGIAVAFPARSSSDGIFINSRRFDDETLSLSGDDGSCSPFSDDGDRGWIMRIPSDVKCPRYTHTSLCVSKKKG